MGVGPLGGSLGGRDSGTRLTESLEGFLCDFPKESLGLHTQLEGDHQRQLAAGKSSQEVQQEAGLAGTQVLEGEQHVGPSEEPGPGACLQCRWVAGSLACRGRSGR